jgi:hypothetical protein
MLSSNVMYCVVLQEGAPVEPFQPYKGWEDFDPSNTLLLTAKTGKPLMLSPQDVQRLTWEEFTDVWKVQDLFHKH